MSIDFNRVEELIKDGFIRKNIHSSGDLFLYNYTDKTQYENFWVPETIQCRGLICDTHNRIVARPFPKFFNLKEHNFELKTDDILNQIEIYEKLDGSLGILYFYNNTPFIATRGSFHGKQALEATNMLNTIYSNSIPLLEPDKTYLFEIIYPDNRIIIDYGNQKLLVLLAVIETKTSKELNLDDFSHLGFPLVKKYTDLDIFIKNFSNLDILSNSNEEGFVIKFSDGTRVKFKFAEYVKLHSLASQITRKKIWELLKNNISFDELIQKLPDEIYGWVKNTKMELLDEYSKLEDIASQRLKEIMSLINDPKNRKEIASYIVKEKYSSILFSMLDNKDYSKYIWQILEPEHEIPLFNKEDN